MSSFVPPCRQVMVASLRTGWRAGLLPFLHAIEREIYFRHRSIWYERPLDDSLKLIPPRFNGHMDYDHPEAVMKFIQGLNMVGPNDPVEISTMLDRGHLFAGVYNSDQMIGFVKLGWGRVYIADYRIELTFPPDTFYNMDSFLMGEWRGKGGGAFIVTASSLEMKRRGFKRRISYIRLNNIPMLKSGRKAGLREIGQVDFRHILGKKIFRPHPASLIDLTHWNS